MPTLLFALSPAAAAMEHLLRDWRKAIVGYGANTAGLLVSGGSMANLCALAAAHSLRERAATSQKPTFRIYVSEEGHFSIQKAARLLGIGSENVVTISTDASLRVDVFEMERQIEADRKAGL
jgi:glutamate/tyrosine decarboxylase-like PLP-dependent enzyme